MAGEPQQKRRRLPFKPPSRTTSAGPSAGPSTAAKDKGKARETTTKPTSTKLPSASAGPSTLPSASKSNPQPSSSKSTSKKRSHEDFTNTLPATPSDLASDSDSETSGDIERPVSEEPDYILAEITHPPPQENIALEPPKINPKLLSGIFHHFRKNDKTRFSKDADAMMAKYMDLFVREAIARGKLERDLVNESKGRTGPADNFIEVEDLETLAPWLIMDF